MPSAYLADELISAVREAGMLPPADESAPSSRIRAIMNREQRVYLMRLLLSVREEYRVAVVDVPLVAGQSSYRIPSRAVGAKLKLVEVVPTTGAAATLNPVGQAQSVADGLAGGGGSYYLRDNSIVLLSTSLTGSLRLHYFRRLNKLVAASAAAEVASFSAGGKTITVTTPPGTFTSSATYDIIQGTPHFDLLAFDEPASVAGSVLTFASSLPGDLAVGDYLALSGESPLCMAPLELHDVLVQRALVKYLAGQGDKANLATAKEDLKELRDDALSLLCPRVQDSPVVLKNYDAPGWNRYRARGMR